MQLTWDDVAKVLETTKSIAVVGRSNSRSV